MHLFIDIEFQKNNNDSVLYIGHYRYFINEKFQLFIIIIIFLAAFYFCNSLSSPSATHKQLLI